MATWAVTAYYVPAHTCGAWTSMDADPQLKRMVRLVLDLEASNFFQQVQGCVCHLGRVTISVAMWEPAYQHVGITNRFNLATVIVQTENTRLLIFDNGWGCVWLRTFDYCHRIIITNEYVRQKININNQSCRLQITKKRKLSWYDHLSEHSSLSNELMQSVI